MSVSLLNPAWRGALCFWRLPTSPADLLGPLGANASLTTRGGFRFQIVVAYESKQFLIGVVHQKIGDQKTGPVNLMRFELVGMS
jgi:hypothetical protein